MGFFIAMGGRMLKRGQQRIVTSYLAGNSWERYVRHFLTLLITLFILALSDTAGHAGTPISLYRTFAGNLNYTTTGGTLRTDSNSGDTCAVTSGPVSAVLSGIPVGATIRAAYLYWAGSGSTPDYDVTFNGNAITADRTFTETFVNGASTYYFFSGFKNVTPYVSGNGTYSFSNLTVDTSALYCGVSAVLSGWSLVVIYQVAAEPLRVVNVYDGFQYFRGSAITLTPSNFRIPASGIDGKHSHITWEGDPDATTSFTLNGYDENFAFNGTLLTDFYNPVDNQFNSTINTLPSTTSYGVDIDTFNVSAYLSPGAGSATTVYSSGNDLVLLSAEVLAVTNTAVGDLSLTKDHIGSFPNGGTGTYQLTVHNNGPSTATGTAGNPIRITDTIPAGLTYSNSSGTGWTVDISALPTVRWNYVGTLASGADLPPVTLQVTVSGSVGSIITNTAAVSGPDFDHDLSNNAESDSVTVTFPTGTGNKPLYLYGSTSTPAYMLSRTPTSGAPAYVTINNGVSQPWNQNPVLQSSVTLTPTLSANVPVYLYLARNNTTGTRNIRVDLQCSSGGTVLTQTQSNLTLPVTPGLFTFSLPLGAALTCAAPNSWRLTITNTTGANRPVRVYPISGGNISRVVLPSQNVINVDSISFYNAAYPAGSLIPSVAPGDMVYIRATVSDPFGSYDINGSAITITDGSGVVRVNSANMNQALDSGAATKIYEYAYAVPAGGPAGNWTVKAVAAEGTEGNVTDEAAATMPVVIPPPSLTVVKSATPAPAVNPGQVVTYTVLVTNTGQGAATNVVLSDSMSPYVAWGMAGFTFTDGAPLSSGLSLGVPEFSQDNGSTWDYTPSSGGGGAPAGYDGTVTNWRIPMTGTMNANGANFLITYTVRVK
jgi:uncharacterized repeat protein (TIGR01451 family)